MAIWVHIVPVIEPDNEEAKSAMTASLTTTLEQTLVKLIGQALSPDKFNTNPASKPKGDGKSYSAIRITATLKLKVDTAGSKMTVDANVRTEFEAIKLPALNKGDLLVSAAKGAAMENRGKGERSIIAFTEELLLIIVGPLVKKIIDNPTFNSYAKSKNLPM